MATSRRVTAECIISALSSHPLELSVLSVSCKPPSCTNKRTLQKQRMTRRLLHSFLVTQKLIKQQVEHYQHLGKVQPPSLGACKSQKVSSNTRNSMREGRLRMTAHLHDGEIPWEVGSSRSRVGGGVFLYCHPC